MKARESLKSKPVQCTIYVIAYVGLAILSRSLSFPNDFAAVWLPAGLSLAVFAYTPRSHWGWWLVGSILSSLIYNYGIQGKGFGVVFGFTIANVTRSLLGGWLLQSLLPGRLRFDRQRDVLVFAIPCCLSAPLLTGVFGSLTLKLAYGTSWSSSFPNWYLGNVIGMVVVAPLVYRCLRHFDGRSRFATDCSPDTLASQAYFVLLLGLLAAISLYVYRFNTAPISYLLAPFLIFLTLRFELCGAAVGSFLMSIIVLSCTTSGFGPMAKDYAVPTQMILSQSFLATLSLSQLILAVAVKSSRRAIQRSERTGRRLGRLQRETQLILDTVPSVILYKDGNNRIIRANQSAAEWLGLPIEEIQGRSIEEIHPGPHASYLQDDRQVIQSGIPKLGYQEKVTLPNGETRWVQTDKVAFPSDDKTESGVIAVLTDITERKVIEKKLERSNQDLEQFAVIASHDLKEPLRAVTGYCQFLKEDYGAALVPEALRFVDKAIEGADRMTQLINDLLEYSRISRAEVTPTPVDLNRVATQAMKDLRDSSDESNAILEVTPLPTILGSHSQMQQLFQNLLSNSLKFVSPNQPPRIVISHEIEPGWLTVSVSDNGIGIDLKHQDRIFQIFQRLHRRSDYPGTGLGLAICARIMQRHNGSISVNSTLGQGTTFVLVFPIEALADSTIVQ